MGKIEELLNLGPGLGFRPDKLRILALFLARAGAEDEGAKEKVRALFADIRYGARAFSTLEGYASRNRETELAPGVGVKPSGTCSHRRGSRLRWIEGRREAGNRLPCVLAAF